MLLKINSVTQGLKILRILSYIFAISISCNSSISAHRVGLPHVAMTLPIVYSTLATNLSEICTSTEATHVADTPRVSHHTMIIDVLRHCRIGSTTNWRWSSVAWWVVRIPIAACFCMLLIGRHLAAPRMRRQGLVSNGMDSSGRFYPQIFRHGWIITPLFFCGM